MPDPSAAADGLVGIIGGGAGGLAALAYTAGKFFEWQKARAKAATPAKPTTMADEYSDTARNIRVELQTLDRHIQRVETEVCRDLEEMRKETSHAHKELSASQAQVAASLDRVADHLDNVAKVLSDIRVDTQVLRQTARG